MKKFFLFLLILIVLLIVGLVVFLMMFDPNSYRPYLTQKLSESLGRPVTIGQMEIKKSMIPTIKIHDIQIANPAPFTAEKPLISIDSAEATLAIAPLFSKRVEVQNIKANKLNLNLIQQGNRNNWTMEKQSTSHPKTPAKKDSWQIRVDSIAAQNISLSYQKADQEYQLNLSDFSLKQLKVFSVTATLLDQTFKITATVDDLLKLMRRDPDYLFNIEAVGAGMTVKLTGSIGDINTLKNLLFNVDVSGASLKQTLETFGIKNRSIPAQPFALATVLQGDLIEFNVTKLDLSLGGNKLKAGFTGSLETLTDNPVLNLSGRLALSDWTLGQVWGLHPFTIDTEFSASRTEVNLKSFLYQASRTDLQASGKVLLNKQKPDLTLNISSEYLNLQDILQMEDSSYPDAAMGGQSAKAWVVPDVQIPLGFLQSFDGVVSIAMPHWQLTDQIIGYLGKAGVISVKNGVLTTNGFRLNILGGNIVADVVANSNNGQSFSLKMQGAELNLNDLKALNNVIKNATADFSVDVQATGSSLKEILSSVSGDLELEVPKGTIIDQWFNNDVVEVLGGRKKRTVNFSTSDQVNELLCGVIKVQIQNGEIKAQNNIALETPHVGFLIGGNIRLSDLWVDLSMRPIIYNKQQTIAGKILNTATSAIRVIGNMPILRPEPDTTQVVSALLDNRSLQPYQTCAKVLGRSSKGERTAEAKKLQMLPEPTVVEEPKQKPQTPQELLKQQLLESLTQVVQ